MSHTIQLSDAAYKAIAEAAAERGQTAEAYIEAWARQQERDPQQAWFWTPEWQAGEQHASAELAAGQSEYFDDEDSFLAALEADADV